MNDPENLQEALARLGELIETDPAQRARPLDAADVRVLLAGRLARATAEAAEVARGSDDPGRRADWRAVVREVFEQDLIGGSGATPGGRMISECDEIVLARTEVPALLLANYVRRRYAILDAAGRELGEVQQLSNPSHPGLSPHPILDVPDLHFNVLDRTIGRTFTFRRAGDQLYILDEVDTQLGFVAFKPGEYPADYKIVSCLDRGMMQVKTDPDRPYSLRVFGSIGDEIGSIERRFLAAGPFLDDENRMRIRVEAGRVSPGQRWGLVAAALLAGVGDEEPPAS